MVDYVVKVKVDTSRASASVDKFGSKIGQVGNTATRVGKLISTAFAAAAASIGIQRVAALADSYTNLRNQLKLVTTDEQNLNDVSKQLLSISNQTRGSFEATVKIYKRTAAASKELGINQKELIQFTKSLNQAVVLSGASSQEATAALIQLSQGIASNRLQGEELRAVFEQLPIVIDIISESMGVARSEIRNLAAQGKISAKEIIDAFLKASDDLNAKFSDTIPTIGQAFTVLGNNLLFLVGQFNTATGAGEGLARSILSLANGVLSLIERLPEIIKALQLLAYTIGPILAVQALGLLNKAIFVATTRLIAFGIAAAANPFGLLITFAGAAYGAFTLFGDEINRLAAEFPVLTGVAAAFLGVVGGALLVKSILQATQSIGLLIISIRALSVALLTNPIFLIGTVIAGVVVYMTLFSSSVSDATEKTTSFGETTSESGSFLNKLFEILGGGTTTFQAYDDGVTTVTKSILDQDEKTKSLSKTFSADLRPSIVTATQAQQDFANQGISSWGKYYSTVSSYVSSLIAKFLQLINVQAKAGAAGTGGGASSGTSGGTPGFATGGSFVVGGSPGVDQNLLSLNGRPVARVSKGERVNVGNGSGGGNPVNINMTVVTPDADSFGRSQGQIAAKTQTALARAARRNG